MTLPAFDDWWDYDTRFEQALAVRQVQGDAHLIRIAR